MTYADQTRLFIALRAFFSACDQLDKTLSVADHEFMLRRREDVREILNEIEAKR